MNPRDLPRDELRRSLRHLGAGQSRSTPAFTRLLRAQHGGEGLDRRRLFQLGGLAAASGVVLAACGEDDTAGTVTVPARLGTVPPPTELPDAAINDIVLLRTASSLEYVAITTYDLVLDNLSSLFTGGAAAYVDVVQRFRDDHQRHADAAASVTEELGGEPYECANPRFMDLYVFPAVELIVGTEAAQDLLGIEGSDVPVAPTDTPLEDVLTLAYGLERVATATYQGAVPVLSDPALRRDVMVVGAEEARHATLLAQVLDPANIIPADEGQFSAVPATFGQLSQVVIQLGLPNEVGAKTTVAIETPSLNSLIYEYLGPCPA